MAPDRSHLRTGATSTRAHPKGAWATNLSGASSTPAKASLGSAKSNQNDPNQTANSPTQGTPGSSSRSDPASSPEYPLPTPVHSKGRGGGTPQEKNEILTRDNESLKSKLAKADASLAEAMDSAGIREAERDDLQAKLTAASNIIASEKAGQEQHKHE